MTRGVHLGIVLVCCLAAFPAHAMVQGRITPGIAMPGEGQQLVVTVELDLTGSGQSLGSYGATLQWDPSVLALSTAVGGNPPFDTPTINSIDASSGLLRFGAADTTGGAGLLSLLQITFDAVACGSTTLDLEFSSLFATTFADLEPLLDVLDGSVSVELPPTSLMLGGGEATTLAWDAVPGATDYDVIRGDLTSLFDDGNAIRLGAVQCIESASIDTTTDTPDTDLPINGQVFFYLVRPNDPTPGSYGATADCSRERLPDVGDCN